MITVEKRYQSKRLDCWQKLRELQADYFQDIWEAKEKGKILVLCGQAGGLDPLLAGLGPRARLDLGIYGGRIGSDQEFAVQCMQAIERQGYARDMCAINKTALGSFILDQGPFGAIPKPDFSFTLSICDTGARWLQVASEHFGIPIVLVDYPLYAPGEQKEVYIDYLVYQMQDAIEQMERITGQEYDDEELIEAIHNDCSATALWAKICQLNKAAPAPLSQMMLRGLRSPLFYQRCEASTVEFYQTVYDEVRDRVQNQIAALATERCRLVHEGQQIPVFFTRILKYVESYGALFIGSHDELALHGGYEMRGDGEWQVAKTPRERGVKMNTRGDALRVLAEWYLLNHNNSCYRVAHKGSEVVKFAEAWHADGFVFHINRGCPGTTWAEMEAMSRVKERGIASMAYEGNAYDSREFAQVEVIDRLESFMESLGLSRIDGV